MTNLRSPYLLIFTGYEHCCYAHQLQLLPLYYFSWEVLIHNMKCQVKRLRHKLKFVMDFDQPVHENSSYPFVDLTLWVHIVMSTTRSLHQRILLLLLTARYMTANAILVVIKLMKAYLRKLVKLVDIINIINNCQLILNVGPINVMSKDRS